MKKNKLLLYGGLLTALLAAAGAWYGLFTQDSYAAETRNWQVQGIAQDMADLFMAVPLLLIALAGAWRGKRFFVFLLGGVLLFLAYSFAIYCFSVHFNKIFLLYCLVLGLSVYLFIYLYSLFPAKNAIAFFTSETPVRSTATYLGITALLFYGLWLSDIIPAIVSGTRPELLKETGLFTNPVHVLDIALLLPGMLICALLLYKKRPVAFFLAPVLLVFSIIMNINIAFLSVMMVQKGLAEGYFVACAMAALSLTGGWLLFRFCRQLAPGHPDKYHSIY